MPMTPTHALIPLAVAIATARRPIPWTLIAVTMFASAAPDIDGLFKHFLGVPENSIYAHRGACHSLFVAVAGGLVGAALHKPLGIRPLPAGVLVTAAMASHGILDMMTDTGQPVAYLWPVSSVRLFADWRPIHGGHVELAHLVNQALARFSSELGQLILPMFAVALAIRAVGTVISKLRLHVAGQATRRT